MNLTESQIDRYSRQLILSEVGGGGQEKLLNAKVLIVGAGGLGSPAALYLGAAGVGEIGIVDSDKVELNNLQRQILHSTKDIGNLKVKSAESRIHSLNEDVQVRVYPLRLDQENVSELIGNYDMVIDGSDNFDTKYLLNDTCVEKKIPLSHGGIFRFDGQTMTILPGKSSCFRCLFSEVPSRGELPTCQQAGILGAVAGVIGTLQATEVLKYLLGIGELLTGKLLIYNALDSFFREVKVPANPECSACGKILTQAGNDSIK